MDAKKYENLKELVEKFVDTNEVQRYISDIQAGDQIFHDYPAPEPDDMLIANIKAEIALNILPRKVKLHKKVVYIAVAIAAAVVIISVISISLFEKQNNPVPVVPSPYNYASIFDKVDLNFEYIKTAIEQVQTNLTAMETSEDDIDNGIDTIRDLEIQNTALNSSDFWEG
jgi:hypothetical protein